MEDLLNIIDRDKAFDLSERLTEALAVSKLAVTGACTILTESGDKSSSKGLSVSMDNLSEVCEELDSLLNSLRKYFWEKDKSKGKR